jgi:hypothetical protein
MDKVLYGDGILDSILRIDVMRNRVSTISDRSDHVLGEVLEVDRLSYPGRSNLPDIRVTKKLIVLQNPSPKYRGGNTWRRFAEELNRWMVYDYFYLVTIYRADYLGDSLWKVSDVPVDTYSYYGVKSQVPSYRGPVPVAPREYPPERAYKLPVISSREPRIP